MNLNGPFVVVCRGHSGGRVVSEAFVRNGIQMGVLDPKTKDTRYFAPARNNLIRELTLSAYDYKGLQEEDKQRQQYQMRQILDDYIAKEIVDPQRPFGWKLGVSLYLAPLLVDAIPTAKIVHLIRDGRDVMLSRLGPARFENLAENPLNKLFIFGRKEVDSFHGVPLDVLNVENVRNELEMTHWVTSVRFGLGLRHSAQYLEVRYEDICKHPVKSFSEIFNFLEVPFQSEASDWLEKTVNTERIGKWKKYPASQLRESIQIGASLLEELGYQSR